MARRAGALGGLATNLIVTLPHELLIDLISALQQEVSEIVRGVVRNILAQVDETFGEVGHNLVHEVLTDRLRALVEQVTLVLANLLKFGFFALLTFDTVALSIFLEQLVLSSLPLALTSLLLFTLNQSLYLINLATRVLLLPLGFLSSQQLLLLLFRQILVLNDIKLSLASVDFTALVGQFSFLGLFLGLSLDLLEELVVGVSD